MLRVLDSLELHQIVFFCSQDLPKGIKWWQTHFYILFSIINVVPTIIIYIVITVHKIAEAHKLSIKTRLIAERYRYIHILTKNYSFRLTKFINKECSFFWYKSLPLIFKLLNPIFPETRQCITLLPHCDAIIQIVTIENKMNQLYRQ